MGRVSRAVRDGLPAAALGVVICLFGTAQAQAPDHVLGTAEGQYQLFTPEAVVAAGGASVAGSTAYKFFEQEALTVAAVSTDTEIPADGAGYSQTLLAPKEFSGGLIAGPFFAQFEGHVDASFSASTLVRYSVATVHDFGQGRKLTSTRTELIRIARQSQSVQLNDFSSITVLEGGRVTLDDGSSFTIDDAALAAPVTISITLTITAENNSGARIDATMKTLNAERPRITWWQLARVAAGDGAPLSDATPKVEAGSGAPGTTGEASRGDHVHPARTIPKQPLSSFGTVGSSGTCAKANSSRDGLTYGDCGSPRVLSNRNPAGPGTADPGNRTDVSRSDHVHPGGGGGATPLSDKTPLVESGSGAAGTGDAASREDHVHPAAGGSATPLSDQTPQNVGAAGKAGSASSASREDHVHGRGAVPREVPAPTNATKLDVPRVKSDGSAYELVDPHVAVLSGLPAITGQATKVLTVNSGATGVEWAKGGSGGGSSGGDSGCTLNTVIDNSTAATTPAPWQAEEPIIFRYTGTKPSGATPGQPSSGQVWMDRLIWVRGPGENGASFVRAQYFTRFAATFRTFRISRAPTTNIITVATQSTNSSSGSFSTFNGPWAILQLQCGGGGGSSGPTIPDPTAAGALEHLRVNAAGSAYELAAPPNYDSDIDDIDSALGALGRVTADLEVASTETAWATNAVVGAGIAIGTAGASTAPTTGYIRDTLARPDAGWAANAIIFAVLPTGSDPTAFRVLEPDVTGTVTLIDAGGSWVRVNASRTDADYYRVNTAGQYDGTLTLQHRSTTVRTRYRGEVVNGELPAIPGDANNKQYALETKGDGSGVEWSNDIFSALNVNAEDIGDALERIGKVDAPGDADASKSALAAGQVWEIKSCSDSGGSRKCTAGFSAERRVNHQLVVHGTGAPNSTTQSFAPTGRLTQHALISGTSYDEFLIIARHISGNPVRTHIRSCRIPGIQGDWLANAAHAVVLTGEGGACSITAPTTGNITVVWVAPLAGQKIAGDTWRLYGVDWQ